MERINAQLRGNKRRQVFTGAGKCTDQTESSHVTVLKLVITAFETMANMRHEDDEQERVHLRSTLTPVGVYWE